MSQMGQKAKYSRRADVFRCSPSSRHSARAWIRACWRRSASPCRCLHASEPARPPW